MNINQIKSQFKQQKSKMMVPEDGIIKVTKVDQRPNTFNPETPNLFVRYEDQDGTETEFTLFNHVNHVNNSKNINIFVDILNCLDDEGRGYLHWTWDLIEPSSSNKLQSTRHYVKQIIKKSKQDYLENKPESTTAEQVLAEIQNRQR